MPGWTEQVREGKEQTNLAGYHHYVNKFTAADGTEYYIRFAVTERAAKAGKTGDSLVHSTAISEVAIYKAESGSSPSLRVIDPATHEQPPFVDKKLQDFFNSVKPDMSLFQGDSTLGYFDPATGVVQLLRKADLSTVLSHRSGATRT